MGKIEILYQRLGEKIAKVATENRQLADFFNSLQLKVTLTKKIEAAT